MIPCASISLAQTISQCLHCFAAATHIPVVALPTGSIRACLARGHSTAYIHIIKTPLPFVNGFLAGFIEKNQQKARGTGERCVRLSKNYDKASLTEQRGVCAGGKGPTARSIRTFLQLFKLQKRGTAGRKYFFDMLSTPDRRKLPVRRGGARRSEGVFFREGGVGVGEVGGAVLDVVEVLVGVEAVVIHLDQGHGDIGAVVRDALAVVQQI